MDKDTKLGDVAKDSEAYKSFLLTKARTHINMKYYSDTKAITSIICDKVLRLSDGDDWNDIQDKRSFNSSGEYKQFGKCFSFSRSESVAMWFIYGRDPKQSCMMDFSTNVRTIVDETTCIRIYNYCNNQIYNEKMLSNDQFELFLCDALYINEKEDGSIRIKWYDQNVDDVPADVIYNLDGLWKTMPWSYESECRLIVRVPKSVLGGQLYNTAEIKLSDRVLNNIQQKVFTGPYYDEKNGLTFATRPSNLRGNIAFER